MSDLLVLCYHGVSPTWRSPYSVSPDRLREQIKGFLRRGYRPATVTAAVGTERSTRTLVVTFDDGLVSVREHARPVLDDLGVPATVFACSDWVGRDAPMRVGQDGWIGGPHERELHSMDWDDLRILREAGWEIGSHTRTHPRLTEATDAELQRELAGSRNEIAERLGVECAALAYPYGAVDDRVVAAARAAGYAVACMARAGTGTDRHRIPRTVVVAKDGPVRLFVKTWRPARRVRDSPAWGVLGPAYARLGGRRGSRTAA